MRRRLIRVLATGAASTPAVDGAALIPVGTASAAPTATAEVPEQTITLQLPLPGRFSITIPARWQCPHRSVLTKSTRRDDHA
jgi:hypothetical protein